MDIQEHSDSELKSISKDITKFNIAKAGGDNYQTIETDGRRFAGFEVCSQCLHLNLHLFQHPRRNSETN